MEDVIFHDGPGQAYLARAPNDDLEHFDGFGGDWFKIAYAGPQNDTAWKLKWKPGVRSWVFILPPASLTFDVR